LLILVALILSSQAPNSPADKPLPKGCEYDSHILDLGFEAFDQDMKGGWRALARQDGCKEKAADLIQQYREKYQAIFPLLNWHEAQLRALYGDTKSAIILMKQSRMGEHDDQFGWNPYVDATIAFLQNDKPGFLRAKYRLEHLKRPKDWPTDSEWPQNMGPVAGLWKCFGQSYEKAYGPTCRPTASP